MTLMKSSEGGGACRLADEGGQQGDCPTLTSSERGREGEWEETQKEREGVSQSVCMCEEPQTHLFSSSEQ